MRVCVVFKDGTEMGMNWPDEALHQGEVTTGRPDRPENVTARFSHVNRRGVRIYREVEAAEAAEKLV